jgi:hypothetical protein
MAALEEGLLLSLITMVTQTTVPRRSDTRPTPFAARPVDSFLHNHRHSMRDAIERQFVTDSE